MWVRPARQLFAPAGQGPDRDLTDDPTPAPADRGATGVDDDPAEPTYQLFDSPARPPRIDAAAASVQTDPDFPNEKPRLRRARSIHGARAAEVMQAGENREDHPAAR
jgi:hypothetical protein